MNIAIVIPALNEAESLPHLLAAIPNARECETSVIVVDNGSTDETARVARTAGATVVTEPRRGYGWACSSGVQAAASSEAIVFLDGDFSSDPTDMAVLIKPLLENRADMVLGSRLLTGAAQAMPPHQHFGNWLTALLMRRLYGLTITDLAPYRAVRTELLRRLELREMTYGYPTEMIAKAARQHARILEVPVRFLPRLAGQSKVSGTVRGSALAAYFILSTTLRHARS